MNLGTIPATIDVTHGDAHLGTLSINVPVVGVADGPNTVRLEVTSREGTYNALIAALRNLANELEAGDQ